MGVHIYDSVECYTDLANAIVRRTAIDYQKALCEDDKKVIKECLKFFKSKKYRAFTNLNGNMLVRMLEIEAKEMNYDWNEISKSHRLNNPKEDELID